jgi:hypothetical protein
VFFLILLLTTLGLIVFLWAMTLFLQATLYTEPAAQLYWGAPAAGAVLGLFFGFWCLLDYNDPGKPEDPGHYDTLFSFSPDEESPFTKFQAKRQGSENKILFEKKGGEFRNAANEKWTPVSDGAIFDTLYIDIDGQGVAFHPELKKPGIFQKESGEVRYLEDGGSRVITEGQVRQGVLYTRQSGVVLMNYLLNFLHLAAWFCCLWLLLRFAWPHALGLSVVLWLIMTLTILPMLITTARNAGRESSGTRATADSHFRETIRGSLTRCA